MTSIRDVADRAGVSTATVSHILNKTRFVSDETRKKVMDAINELNYYPSRLARGLANSRSQTIGIIFSDIANPHFTQIFKGIENYFYGHGYDLILANTSEDNRIQEDVLTSLISGSVDGLILASTSNPSENLRLIKEKGLPIVLVDRKDPEIDLPLVGVDNQLAVYKATRHLFSDGHIRIGIVLGLKNISTTGERLAGFVQAYKEKNIPIDQSLIYWGDSSIESGYLGTKELLAVNPCPTAIFCTNNLMALGTLHAIRDLGLKCPDDISIIGFDDHSWADIFTPPLTVIAQPTFEMGVTAAKQLHHFIKEGVPKTTPRRINLKTKLIIRGSCSTTCFHRFSLENRTLTKRRR
jgi:LacI family transcriptional regulator